jgi:hypothetical protein
MKKLKNIKRFDEVLENLNSELSKDTSSSDVNDNEVQFLLTLNVDDLDRFNEKIKDIKYKIIRSTSDAVTLSGCESSVRIERIK